MGHARTSRRSSTRWCVRSTPTRTRARSPARVATPEAVAVASFSERSGFCRSLTLYFVCFSLFSLVAPALFRSFSVSPVSHLLHLWRRYYFPPHPALASLAFRFFFLFLLSSRDEVRIV